MLLIPTRPRWFPLLTVLVGAITFLWLSAEDTVWLVTLFGFMLALLGLLHGVFRFAGRVVRPRLWIPAAGLLGALLGASTAVMTILLMVMKTSLHNHIYPDYPFPLMAGIAERLTTWSLAGALFGLALALLHYALSKSSASELSGGSS